MGTSISTTRVTTYHGYPAHLLPASAVPLGDHGDSLMEAEGPPDDYEEAGPLTVKTQNHGNGDDYFLYGYWRDDSYYDSNGIDWPDVRKKFNPQIIHRGK